MLAGPTRQEETATLSDASADVLERARKIRMVLLDSDGVLTDGRIIVTGDGGEARSFDVRDGHGIRMGQRAGLLFGVISGRESRALDLRASELDFVEIHQRVLDKLERVDEIVSRRGIGLEELCFVGDDVIDLPVMRRCGRAVAPCDAVADVRGVAHYVTQRRGGRGAVRELVELLLKANGSWNRVMARYLGEA
jgi:3-deoxy-D-manno-octulosonate 8-phosphate phosphatase (KDO 8-P phosphatase)